MELITLNADERVALGKKTRALRRGGITPIHVYGLSKPSRALQTAEKEVLKVVQQSGKTSVVTINIGGDSEQETCLARDLDVDPRTGRLLHVDFLRVAKDRKVEVEIPIKLVNTDTAPIVRSGAVNVVLVLSKVWIKALPDELPAALEVDCGNFTKATDTVKTGDLNLPKGGSLIGSPDLRVISLQASRAARAQQGPAPSSTPAAATAPKAEESAPEAENTETTPKA